MARGDLSDHPAGDCRGEDLSTASKLPSTCLIVLTLRIPRSTPDGKLSRPEIFAPRLWNSSVSFSSPYFLHPLLSPFTSVSSRIRFFFFLVRLFLYTSCFVFTRVYVCTLVRSKPLSVPTTASRALCVRCSSASLLLGRSLKLIFRESLYDWNVTFVFSALRGLFNP